MFDAAERLEDIDAEEEEEKKWLAEVRRIGTERSFGVVKLKPRSIKQERQNCFFNKERHFVF